MAVHAITRARNYTDDVEFSCEDAGRTPIDHLCRIVENAIKAGATTVNIPDTVGYTLPYEFGGIIRTLFNKVPNIDKAVISVHCHNDLGMATANSLSAVIEGARQIECTVNGLGERAGNTSLEEVVMSMKLRSSYMNNVYTNIISENIARASQVVSGITNEPVPSHKAIVGSNAFAHSSGIHQDGVLKNKQTYEILTPQSVGFKENNMHMTARSGRHMIKAVLEKLGYRDYSYNLDDVYSRFLKLADRKGQVFDYEWCWRAWHQAGLRSFMVEQAPLFHQIGEGDKKIGAKNVSIPAPFRVYYQYRNYLWLCQRSYVPKYWKKRHLIKYAVKTFYYPLCVSPRGQYARHIAKGIFDGLFKKDKTWQSIQEKKD